MKRFVVLSLIVLFITSCGTMQVTTKPDVVLSKSASITIAQQEDQTGTVGELNHLLFSKGFNVIAYSTAKKAMTYKEKNTGDDMVNNETNAELHSFREINSIYALELNYTYYYDMLYWAYRNFSARVVDLETGEIVMSAYFRGDRSVRSVLNEFVNKLDEQVR